MQVNMSSSHRNLGQISLTGIYAIETEVFYGKTEQSSPQVFKNSIICKDMMS